MIALRLLTPSEANALGLSADEAMAVVMDSVEDWPVQWLTISVAR